jgi:hypothetical protein
MSTSSKGQHVFSEDCYIVKTNTRGTAITIADCSDYGVLSVSPHKEAHREDLLVYPYQTTESALMSIEPVQVESGTFLGRIMHRKGEPSQFHVRDLESDTVIGTFSVDRFADPPQVQEWIVDVSEDSEAIIIKPAQSSAEKLRFGHSGYQGSKRVCEFESADGIGTRYVKADFSMDTDHELDVRLGLAVAVKLVEGIVLHGFHSDR